MNDVNKIEQLIEYKLLIPKEDCIGCTQYELERLEQLVYSQTNFGLPNAYQNFLSIGGHRIGSLLLGVGMSYAKVVSRMKAFWEDNSLLKNVPTNAFIFFFKDSPPSYYAYFLLGDGEDPVVYEYDLNQKTINNTTQTFKEHLLEGIQNSYEFRSLVPLHFRIVLFHVKKQLLSLNSSMSKTDLSFWEERLKDKIVRFGERVNNLPMKAKSKIEEITYIDFKTFLEELKTHTISHLSEINNTLFKRAVKATDEALKHLAFKPTIQNLEQLKLFKKRLEQSSVVKQFFATKRLRPSFLEKENFSEEQYLWYFIQLEHYAWSILLKL